MAELYDSIGTNYRRFRRPDPRIQRVLLRALDGLGTVVNVGAGTGSYEPRDRFVVAVEPSMVMIRQRSQEAAPAVQATATDLPFRDGSFDGSLAILTIHHWEDWRRGLRELVRAARRRVVVLTWDPSAEGFWLVEDYFPEILRIDRQIFPGLEALREELGHIRVEPVAIPHDCTDGFLGAYLRRPHLSRALGSERHFHVRQIVPSGAGPGAAAGRPSVRRLASSAWPHAQPGQPRSRVPARGHDMNGTRKR